jgi:hypothetical protein
MPTRPHAHWAGTVEPLLRTLAPRAVWVQGEDELCQLVREHAERLGYAALATPDARTEVVVVSGAPNHHLVRRAVEAAQAPGAHPEDRPPVIVVAATGWPHADRDGYVEPDAIPVAERRAYARCLPDPDATWLSAERTTLAYALESGGEGNGVWPALERLLASGEWQARRIEGFGGMSVLAPERRLASEPALQAAWTALGEAEAHAVVARALDLELGRAELRRARLERELAELRGERDQLRESLAAAVAELEDQLGADRERVHRLGERVGEISAAISVRAQQARSLEKRAMEAEALAAAAREELQGERQWVAVRARSAAGSQAWRVGHRLSKLARLLTFRRDRGTDALAQIVAHVERGLKVDRR